MRVLLINVVCGIRSTGRICTDLASTLEAQGHEVKIAYGRETVPERFQKYAVKIGSDLDVRLHGVQARLLDGAGFGSQAATKRFLEWADHYNPDLLWLHNIHGYYINVPMLFHWIKKRPNMEVRWTLHDCWAFTGHCAHFNQIDCRKWETHCEKCPLKSAYPASLFIDHSFENYDKKRTAFTNVEHMTIITPSQWLADLVKKSFLGDYPVQVQHNTIDTTVFKPTPSDFRKKYGLENKVIVLGVASAWSEGKGLYDFYKLSEILDDKFQIVLVGLTARQMKELPTAILGIERTTNVTELAQIYTASDVFFNPTYADTFPTVNLEAEACGTRVITYDTGGAPETIHRADSIVIHQGAYQRIVEILNHEKL